MNAEDQNGHEETTGTREIGAALARTRREKGLSLRDVENATKIRTRYLEGLEQEDFGMLPDLVYVRGFLKTYANFLGLDGEELSREFKERRGPRRERHLTTSYESSTTQSEETEQPLITPGGLGGARRRRISGATLLTLALAVLILAAVSGGLYLVGSRSSQEPSQDLQEQQQQPAEEDQQGATGGSDDPAENTTPEMVRATVRVVGTSSTGLTIRTDGTVAYDQVAQAGFSREFEAESSLNVSAANGGAVEVELDGQDAERLGNPGQGVTREFTPEDSGG